MRGPAKAPLAPILLSLLVSVAAGAADAQSVGADTTLRIGFVLPSRTGEMPVRSSVNDYIGEGALMGARLAEGAIGEEMRQEGRHLDLLFANAPSPEAAGRAAARLVEVDQVAALVGGIGDGQAEVLSRLAAEAGVPFFNIGSTSDALRGAACNRYSFHVEASDTMYLDAMAAVAAAQERYRWFVIHEDTDAGAGLMEAATGAITAPEIGGSLAGSAAVPKAAPSYFTALQRAEEAGAEMIVLLLDPFDQMVFLQQQASAGNAIPTMAFPATLTQTRDYIAAARYNAAATNPRHRVALWETTLSADGADAFNEAFSSRWGEPADPSAWAAYGVVEILAAAAEATRSTKADDLVVGYLESPAAVFDVLKGPGVSFRPWDHQLRQPLYDVVVDQEVEWARMSLPSRIAIARLGAEIPPSTEDDPVDTLDRLGTTAEETACRF